MVVLHDAGSDPEGRLYPCDPPKDLAAGLSARSFSSVNPGNAPAVPSFPKYNKN